MKKLAVLTGGGDAPGLNGILESVTLTLHQAGVEVIGINDGFEGVFENRHIRLTPDVVRGTHAVAGSFIGTSNRSSTEKRESEFLSKLQNLGVEGLIVAGGDGTFNALAKISTELKLIGVPKTIDNDLAGTDTTFGYDTACSVVSEAVDSLKTTANTHRRIMVVEAMGRTAGWIALGGGLAGYADAILIPERPFDQQALLEFINNRKKSQRGLILVVSEGASPLGGSARVAFSVPGSPEASRLGGISFDLARWIEQASGFEARNVVLGHLQRSAPPTTTDRFLTLEMGIEAARAALSGDWNKAIVSRNGKIERAPIADLMKPARLVTPDHPWVRMAQSLGIFI